jgi:hypothetical protein
MLPESRHFCDSQIIANPMPRGKLRETERVKRQTRFGDATCPLRLIEICGVAAWGG